MENSKQKEGGNSGKLRKNKLFFFYKTFSKCFISPLNINMYFFCIPVYSKSKYKKNTTKK
jgi:hypothetical protein